VIPAPAISAQSQEGPARSSCMPLPMATRSAAMFSVFATTSATIKTPIQARAHRLKWARASSPRVFPVARAVRSQISWIAIINGSVISAVHNSPNPNCAPACAYVAIPDGHHPRPRSPNPAPALPTPAATGPAANLAADRRAQEPPTNRSASSCLQYRPVRPV
jgi:hypothetical protein